MFSTPRLASFCPLRTPPGPFLASNSLSCPCILSLPGRARGPTHGSRQHPPSHCPVAPLPPPVWLSQGRLPPPPLHAGRAPHPPTGLHAVAWRRLSHCPFPPVHQPPILPQVPEPPPRTPPPPEGRGGRGPPGPLVVHYRRPARGPDAPRLPGGGGRERSISAREGGRTRRTSFRPRPV